MYYRAILTKYLPATNFRGSRITAWDSEGHRVTQSYNSGVSTEEAHQQVAYALRDKMNWKGKLIGGGLKTGMVWVFAN